MTLSYYFGDDEEYEYEPEQSDLAWEAIKLWCKITIPKDKRDEMKKCGAYKYVIESIRDLLDEQDGLEELCERFADELTEIFEEEAERQYLDDTED